MPVQRTSAEQAAEDERMRGYREMQERVRQERAEEHIRKREERLYARQASRRRST